MVLKVQSMNKSKLGVVSQIPLNLKNPVSRSDRKIIEQKSLLVKIF
tara:strand:- start:451 stop:588 length:138 start_codon:yes stop_codon:yes gene_type:complete